MPNFFCLQCVFLVPSQTVTWHLSFDFVHHKSPLWHICDVTGCNWKMTLVLHAPQVTHRQTELAQAMQSQLRTIVDMLWCSCVRTMWIKWATRQFRMFCEDNVRRKCVTIVTLLHECDLLTAPDDNTMKNIFFVLLISLICANRHCGNKCLLNVTKMLKHCSTKVMGFLALLIQHLQRIWKIVWHWIQSNETIQKIPLRRDLA